jgi:hypothetical protein
MSRAIVRVPPYLEGSTMDKTTAGLLGAVATLATMGVAQAATEPAPNPSQFMQAASYADLLAPVQNPTELMKADDAMRAERGTLQDDVDRTPENVQLADWHNENYHHHHHHHHQAYNRHHHHHHHHQAGVVIPGVGVVVR